MKRFIGGLGAVGLVVVIGIAGWSASKSSENCTLQEEMSDLFVSRTCNHCGAKRYLVADKVFRSWVCYTCDTDFLRDLTEKNLADPQGDVTP